MSKVQFEPEGRPLQRPDGPLVIEGSDQNYEGLAKIVKAYSRIEPDMHRTAGRIEEAESLVSPLMTRIAATVHPSRYEDCGGDNRANRISMQLAR
jgi:hypothetical protein